MLRLTFAYKREDYCDFITTEFDDEVMELAVELGKDEGYADMNIYHRCFEAEDLCCFQREVYG